MTMPRCVIVCGAPIGNYARIRKYLRNDDFFIFCDCGLAHSEPLEVMPSLIVGDFDSHPKPDTDMEMIVLPCEKDDTDSVFAAKEGIRRGYDDFLIIGAIGGRLDHTLANVSILAMLETAGKTAIIIDDHSVMQIVSDKWVRISDIYSFFSVLNIFGTAEGIDIVDAKYTLTDGVIGCDYQYGVSNEVLPGKTASVRVKKGKALLIKDE